MFTELKKNIKGDSIKHLHAGKSSGKLQDNRTRTIAQNKISDGPVNNSVSVFPLQKKDNVINLPGNTAAHYHAISNSPLPVQMAGGNLKDKIKANPVGYGAGFGAIAGGLIGAAVGTVLAPGVGTAAGAAIGAGGGALLGSIAGGIWQHFRGRSNAGANTLPVTYDEESPLVRSEGASRIQETASPHLSLYGTGSNENKREEETRPGEKKNLLRTSSDLLLSSSPRLVLTSPKMGYRHVNERRERWGGVVEVEQGVGVEVIDPEYQGKLLDHPYVRFIQHQLNLMKTTPIGSSLIEQFGEHGGFKAREIDTANESNRAYKGIKVIIGKPYKSAKNRVIETSEQTGIKEANNNFSPDPRGNSGIPRINFFAPPENDEPTLIGDSGAIVTGHGIERHKDFPEQPQPFDLVLAHEFVHAYLSQSGIFKRLISRDYPEKANMIKIISGTQHEEGLSHTLSRKYADLVPTLEEILVVGIENEYRWQRKQEARQSYHSVNIHANPFGNRPWRFSLDPKEIIRALMGIGMSEENAVFVAMGKQ